MTRTQAERDAKGQFAPSQADRCNNGLSSATPRAVTGKDDATLENSDRKPSPDPDFDIREQTNRRD